MEADVGSHVRLKRRPLESLFGPGTKHKSSGGDGVVVRVEADDKGDIYWVRLNRNGREHSGREEDLVVHRKKHRCKMAPKGIKARPR